MSGTSRISLVFWTYNQEKFVAEALRSLLSQECDDCEVIISDDCSTDQTPMIIRDAIENYQGVKNIKVLQNAKNLGISGNLNRAVEASVGDIIVPFAGDDVALPGRAREAVKAFELDGTTFSVSFQNQPINDEGVYLENRFTFEQYRSFTLEEFLQHGAEAQKIMQLCGCTRAYKREVFTAFPPLNPECAWEDDPLLLRSLMLGRTAQIPKVVLKRRYHSENNSGQKARARVRFSSVVKQVESDSNVATQQEIISRRDRDNIVHMIKQRELIYLLYQSLVYKRTVDATLLKRVLLSSGYSLREKVGLFRRWALRRPV